MQLRARIQEIQHTTVKAMSRQSPSAMSSVAQQVHALSYVKYADVGSVGDSAWPTNSIKQSIDDIIWARLNSR